MSYKETKFGEIIYVYRPSFSFYRVIIKRKNSDDYFIPDIVISPLKGENPFIDKDINYDKIIKQLNKYKEIDLSYKYTKDQVLRTFFNTYRLGEIKSAINKQERKEKINKILHEQ